MTETTESPAMTAAETLLEVLLDGPLYIASLARHAADNPVVPGTMGMTQAQVLKASRELIAVDMLRSEPAQNHGHKAGAMWFAA